MISSEAVEHDFPQEILATPDKLSYTCLKELLMTTLEMASAAAAGVAVVEVPAARLQALETLTGLIEFALNKSH